MEPPHMRPPGRPSRMNGLVVTVFATASGAPARAGTTHIGEATMRSPPIPLSVATHSPAAVTTIWFGVVAGRSTVLLQRKSGDWIDISGYHLLRLDGRLRPGRGS